MSPGLFLLLSQPGRTLAGTQELTLSLGTLSERSVTHALGVAACLFSEKRERRSDNHFLASFYVTYLTNVSTKGSYSLFMSDEVELNQCDQQTEAPALFEKLGQPNKRTFVDE